MKLMLNRCRVCRRRLFGVMRLNFLIVLIVGGGGILSLLGRVRLFLSIVRLVIRVRYYGRGLRL